jgi:nitrite reductase/ring-hydroxylating ferredoxin subunit
MPEEHPSRRRFFASGAAVCGAGLVVRSAEAAAREKEQPKLIALPFGEYKDLARVGGFVEAELPDRTEVIVAHVEQGRFVCCSLRCTHANCKVTYDAKNKRFACPCHNSQFDLDGKPIAGPARKPLTRFETEPAVVVRTGGKER